MTTELEKYRVEAWIEITEGLPSSVIESESPGLESYSFAIAVFRDAERRIRLEGLVVSDAKGVPVPHPALKMQRDASSDIAK